MCSVKWPRGRLAQLEERLVRNEEVASSSLVPSTKIPLKRRVLSAALPESRLVLPWFLPFGGPSRPFGPFPFSICFITFVRKRQTCVYTDCSLRNMVHESVFRGSTFVESVLVTYLTPNINRPFPYPQIGNLLIS